MIIRSGELGAYVKTRLDKDKGVWVDAYWDESHSDKVVDVTGEHTDQTKLYSVLIIRVLGAGNAFLGGLAAGLELTDGDIRRGEHKTQDY